MESELPPIIYEIRDRILSCVQPEKIILFGSYAYGTPRKDSDVDIYIVLPDDFPTEGVFVSIAASHAISQGKLHIPTDIIVHHKSHFEAMSKVPSMERKIAREGKVIYTGIGSDSFVHSSIYKDIIYGIYGDNPPVFPHSIKNA
jgi:predicted nucleotidyltransferase